MDYELKRGPHSKPEEGMCAMEFVAYLAGEPHSDAPASVDVDLRELFIRLNDRWDDYYRQKLRPYLVRTIGTMDDGLAEERYYALCDWLVHDAQPTLFYTSSDHRRRATWRLPRITGPATLDLVCEKRWFRGVTSEALTGKASEPGMYDDLMTWLWTTDNRGERWPCIRRLLDSLLPVESVGLPDPHVAVAGGDVGRKKSRKRRGGVRGGVISMRGDGLVSVPRSPAEAVTQDESLPRAAMTV